MKKRVRVTVPASTANLGPGFDALGMALTLYNTVEVEVGGEGKRVVEVAGEGAGDLPRGPANLVCRVMEDLWSFLGCRIPGWRVRLRNAIPLKRGLGSSAAAIVGGLVAANALAGEPLSVAELLARAAAWEGHPDNVAAALLGVVVVVVQGSGSLSYHRFVPPAGLRVVAVVPALELGTEEARRVLPEFVPLRDAVFNLGRAALLVCALAAGDWNLLGEAVVDRLHQPYRRRLVPGLEEALAAAREAGAFGAFLSGAGPTVVALAPAGSRAGEAVAGVFRARGIEARVLDLEPSPRGAHAETTD